eukprot:714888-Lingulodinium_polyedra.AAC.1
MAPTHGRKNPSPERSAKSDSDSPDKSKSLAGKPSNANNPAVGTTWPLDNHTGSCCESGRAPAAPASSSARTEASPCRKA